MTQLIPIKNYEGLYSITRDGRVWSHPKNHNRNRNGKWLNNINNKGYLYVGLTINGICTAKRVHRLVAEAYIPNPDNKPQVNHKDGNKLNNNDWNLEWSTSWENINHAIKTGLMKGAKIHSKYKGVYWRKSRKMWNALFYYKGKHYYIGSSNNEEDTHNIYLKGKKEIIEKEFLAQFWHELYGMSS